MPSVALLSLLFACTAGRAGDAWAGSEQPDRPATPVAIEHVTVLPMVAGATALHDMTIVIANGRIESMGASRTSSVPRGTRRVNASGKWLLPALADMHVHLENDRLMRLWLEDSRIPDGAIQTADISIPYVANGVLQIANLSAMSEAIGQRIQVESGAVIGPHMALGAMIDGQPPVWPLGMTRVAATPADGRQAVRDIKAEGYDFVKVYNHLDVETFSAIVEEARNQRMQVVGHLTARRKYVTEKLFQPGFGMVAHLQEYSQQARDFSEEEIRQFVEMTKRNGTWVITTLSTDQRLAQTLRDPEQLKTWPYRQYVHPLMYWAWVNHNKFLKDRSPERLARIERTAQNSAKLLRAMHEAGVPLVPGTDMPMPGQVPGFSLHDELEAMAAAGMPNADVLQSATRLPAVWLGVAEDRGTVEVGKRADLLVLDADPLVEVANLRKISAVIASGRYLSRKTLDTMLSDLVARYAAMPVPRAADAAPVGGSSK